jgi:hypothetical protein
LAITWPLAGARRKSLDEARRHVEQLEPAARRGHQILAAPAHLGNRGAAEAFGIAAREEQLLLAGDQLRRVQREHRLAAPDRLPLEADMEGLDPAADPGLDAVEPTFVDHDRAHRPHRAPDRFPSRRRGADSRQPHPFGIEIHRAAIRLDRTAVRRRLAVRVDREVVHSHAVLGRHRRGDRRIHGVAPAHDAP